MCQHISQRELPPGIPGLQAPVTAGVQPSAQRHKQQGAPAVLLSRTVLGVTAATPLQDGI